MDAASIVKNLGDPKELVSNLKPLLIDTALADNLEISLKDTKKNNKQDLLELVTARLKASKDIEEYKNVLQRSRLNLSPEALRIKEKALLKTFMHAMYLMQQSGNFNSASIMEFYNDKIYKNIDGYLSQLSDVDQYQYRINILPRSVDDHVGTTKLSLLTHEQSKNLKNNLWTIKDIFLRNNNIDITSAAKLFNLLFSKKIISEKYYRNVLSKILEYILGKKADNMIPRAIEALKRHEYSDALRLIRMIDHIETTWIKDEGTDGFFVSAPFKVQDIKPKTSLGRDLIESIIAHLNQGKIPNPHESTLFLEYNKKAPISDENKAIIYDYARFLFSIFNK
jgi:hypothetical protein